MDLAPANDSSGRIRRRPDGPLFMAVDDEVVGLDPQAGMVYGLNASAGRVWDLVENWTTLDEVCEQLQREYNVEPATCLEQVGELVARLRTVGLIEVDRG